MAHIPQWHSAQLIVVTAATHQHSRVASDVDLTLCSVRLPAEGVTGAGVAFTADTGVLEMGAVGTGGTGGGVVGIGAAAAGEGVGAGGSAGVGCGGGAAGDGGGFSAAPAASPDIKQQQPI